MRLIDADELLFNINGAMAVSPTGYIHGDTVVEMINDAPTIEPKKGTWYEHYSHEDGERDGVRCSECGTHYYFGGQLMNYCPNCGADMREGVYG